MIREPLFGFYSHTRPLHGVSTFDNSAWDL